MNNELVTLDHVNLTVRSFSESAEWYKRVFGFLLVEEGVYGDGTWGILRNGDFMLCIYESPSREVLSGESSDRFHHVYHFGLRIRDRKQWEGILEREALETYYSSPVRYPHSLSWYIKDPTGHMIEVAYWQDDQVKFG